MHYALFEGVGEVVFVEDCVAWGEELGEEYLGVGEGIYNVEVFLVEICGADAIYEGVSVVGSYYYSHVQFLTNLLAKFAV